MKLLPLKNKAVLVLGLGVTGLSLARWLRAQGACVAVADSRDDPPQAAKLKEEMPEVPLFAGAFRAEPFYGAEILAISPGVPLAEPLVVATLGRGIPVVGDIELFAQALPAGSKVLAITGSNGKSTVTEMVGAMARACGRNTVVAGNIGLPVLDALARVEREREQVDLWVLELSSFQLETTESLNAMAATVLNVSEDHLDRYPGMAEYAAAKARIFQGDGVQVLNRDDAFSMKMRIDGRKTATFGLGEPQAEGDFGLRSIGGERWLAEGQRNLMPLAQLPLAGLHNAANALAALALCRAAGLPYPPLLEALVKFKGLPHRVEKVAELDGVTFFDDSKGTNVGATAAALSGMPRKVVLIAGGDGKGQDFSPLAGPVAGHARAVVLIGRDAPLIEAALRVSGVPMLRAADMDEAVRTGFEAAQPGDAVLLSPACASFDMFRNYEHRAQAFVEAVRRLGGEGAR
ncbi:MAG: UDP-N-acetylmuramoyl-L-alanine--D-glutamate ligase [Pseudomonadota bacterium]|jgi:UDP-N-acetylmuramoylalanine--D-glutamate ligase